MRFPVLNFIGQVLRGLGWLLMFIGIVEFLGSVALVIFGHVQDQYQYQFSPYTQYGAVLAAAVPFAVSIYVFIWGLFMVASGESILVLLAIEENTRTTPLEPAAQFMQLLVKIERNTRPAPDRDTIGGGAG